MLFAGSTSELFTIFDAGSILTDFTGAEVFFGGCIAISPMMWTTRTNPAAMAKESRNFLAKPEFRKGDPLFCSSFSL